MGPHLKNSYSFDTSFLSEYSEINNKQLVIQVKSMDRKEVKTQQKKLRTQMITIIEATPGWYRLPEDAPEVQQVRELQRKITQLEKMRPPRINKFNLY